MKFTKFVIKNFKGVEHAELTLNQLEQGATYTLVGLNESGKTTILEAINSFSPDVPTETIFQNDVFRRIKEKDLVPKHKKDNFSEKVKVEAYLDISNEDKEKIKQYYEKELLLDIGKLDSSLKVVKYFTFKNLDFIEQRSSWTS